MTRVADMVSVEDICVVRFDFAYMRARAETGARKPPPRAEALVAEYRAAVVEARRDLAPGGRLLIGGKSLGGRVASLAAQELFDAREIHGLVCLSYPFHPPNKPKQLRTRHLVSLTCPTLIVQGERDPFGSPAEIAGYGLSPAIAMHWAADGDHDLAPRRNSGATLEGNLGDAAKRVTAFAQTC